AAHRWLRYRNDHDTQGGVVTRADPLATPERLELRRTVRSFMEREVLPHLDTWEAEGELPRSLHRKAGEAGLLGVALPEKAGGGGGDFLDALVVTEEIHYAGGSGGLVASLLTCGIAVPHMAAVGDPDQIEKWVAPALAGDKVCSLAITEPDGGSDVAGIRTTARREAAQHANNGAKTCI